MMPESIDVDIRARIEAITVKSFIIVGQYEYGEDVKMVHRETLSEVL
jgi:hypothetical protein